MSLIEELKRRNVFRVGLAYVVVAWLTAQVADLVLENITAPDWLMQTILLFLAIGFPLALIFAWAFEVTPEGIKKEKDVDRSQSITPQTGRKLNGMIMAVLVIAVAYFAYDKFALRPASDATAVETASQGVETPTAATKELPREKSIAVLPFANRSSRAEDEFFTEGIHDDLLTHLAKIGSMKVISRTSVLRYKDTKKSIPEIAAELKVTTVLEGGIQRSGEQIRINVQLIDAETDEHLWAEIFDRKLTAENLFAIQSEISTKIAEALEATLSPEEESRLKEVPTTNMAAYNAYLRGRQLQEKRTSADLEQALAEFTRATELDPNYALAWVGVADSAALLSSYGTYDWNESNEVEDRAIKKALAINSELGEAYASLAGQYAFREQHDEAEAAYKKAIDLSPNYARAYHWYSGFLSNTPDRLDQSLALLEKASELDPLSSILQSGVADRLGRLGRYDEAEAQYLKVIELDPDFAANYNNLSGFYSDRLGRFAEALKWSRVAREKDPGNITLLFRESLLNLHVQDYAAVEALHQEMLDMDSQHWSVGFTDAVTNMSRGNFAGAAEAVQWVLPKVAHQPNFQQFVGLVFALDRKFTQAREVVEQAFPAWKDPAQWDSMIRSFTFDACLVAGIFAGTGDADKAQKLQEQVIEYYALLETKLDHAYTWAPLDCLVASGDHDRALDLLETQVENGFIAWWWVNYDMPWWDEIRTEPRFQAAMQSIQDQVAVQRQLIEEMNL